MPSMGFEPADLANERSLTHTSDRAATIVFNLAEFRPR